MSPRWINEDEGWEISFEQLISELNSQIHQAINNSCFAVQNLFVIKLRKVQLLKETAKRESMLVGNRGRGSNSPTYSITLLC